MMFDKLTKTILNNITKETKYRRMNSNDPCCSLLVYQKNLSEKISFISIFEIKCFGIFYVVFNQFYFQR